MAHNHCQYNHEVECDTDNCGNCGWNPVVAERGLRNFRGEHKLGSKLYRIPFTGYCEVWAETLEEATQKAEKDEMFTVMYDFGDPICLEKEEKNELD
jgi:hypothetical protein